VKESFDAPKDTTFEYHMVCKNYEGSEREDGKSSIQSGLRRVDLP